jgi:antitoxin MazE
MKTRVQKHGDGLALVLPSTIADRSGLTADSEVEVTCENGAVVARPLVKRQFTLAELVAQITPENRHPETDTGPAVGREVW